MISSLADDDGTAVDIDLRAFSFDEIAAVVVACCDDLPTRSPLLHSTQRLRRTHELRSAVAVALLEGADRVGDALVPTGHPRVRPVPPGCGSATAAAPAPPRAARSEAPRSTRGASASTACPAARPTDRPAARASCGSSSGAGRPRRARGGSAPRRIPGRPLRPCPTASPCHPRRCRRRPRAWSRRPHH